MLILVALICYNIASYLTLFKVISNLVAFVKHTSNILRLGYILHFLNGRLGFVK